MIKFVSDDDMRGQLLTALDTVEQIVCSTMGAKGFNVGIPVRVKTEQGDVTQDVTTKDGISVLESLFLHEDKMVRYAAKKVYASVRKQWENIGDGTTLCTLMCIQLYKRLVELYESDKTQNIHTLAGQVNDLAVLVREELEKQKVLVTCEADLIDIATISANNDAVLGKIIAETVWKVGRYGKVESVMTNKPNTEVVFHMGYKLQGVADPNYLAIHRTIEYKSDNSPAVLITTEQLNKQEHLATIIKVFNQMNTNQMSPRPLIVLCTDFTGICRDGIFQLSMQTPTPLPIFPVLFSQEGSDKIEVINDLVALTGATPLGSAFKQFKNLDLKDLGNMASLRISKDETVLKYDEKEKPEVNTIVANIQTELDGVVTDERKEWLKERIAKLTSGVAVIKVGGKTNDETRYRDDLFDDAIKSCMAALEDGYLIGGGMSLYGMSKTAQFLPAVQAPARKIYVENGGFDIQQLNIASIKGQILDIFTGATIEPTNCKVIDPFKSVVNAIEVAAAFAALLITTKHLGLHE